LKILEIYRKFILFIEKYTPACAEEVVALWNESMPSIFKLDLRLWHQNVDSCDRIFKNSVLVARDHQSSKAIGLLICKLPKNISAILVHPKFRRQGIGTELLKEAITIFSQSETSLFAQKFTGNTDPVSTLVTGQDFAHFFPGIPDDFKEARAFFEKNGWLRDGGACYDLRRNLKDFEISEDIKKRISQLKNQGIEILACQEENLDALYELFSDNFSPRWLEETRLRAKIEQNPNQIIIALKDSKVIGFSHIFTNQSKKIGSPIYWRNELGANYGGLGPIGVSKDFRKIGLGIALLSVCVETVKKSGVDEMVIDWTGLLDFYGRLGFKPWISYTSYTYDI
jgi:GNAT superfamily N-acetyltransferase